MHSMHSMHSPHSWRRLRGTLLGLAAALVLASACPALVTAQEAPVKDRATSFEAVSGAVKEDVPGGPLLLVAYGFVWLALFGYVLRLGKLQSRVETNLAGLERALQKTGTGPRG